MVMKECCGVYALRIALGITMLALLLAGSANAANLTVCPDGCAYSSIQKAIKASSSGDIILVQSGTYFEKVNVNKKLTLRGIGNPVVDAGRSGSAITLSANGITLEGFTATGSGRGSFFESPEAGIRITSNRNTLTGNNASNNSNGISLSFSSNNTLNGNKASSNNKYGIYLYYSSNNTLSGNMMTGNKENFNLEGDKDSHFDNHIETDNLVDGRPIFYIIKFSDTTYDSFSNAGTFYCISCANVTIKNLNLNKNGNGIFFWNTSRSRIQNVNASNNGHGIYLSYSSKNTMNNNNVSMNNDDGIYLSYSSKNTMNNNNASSNNDHGVYLSSSSNNRLNNNNASNNEYGITLDSSSKNMLIGNNASNNDYGIYLSYSNNNRLRGNNASKNNYGIYLYTFSNQNRLIDNNVSNNGKGIFLLGSGNNKMSRNTMIGNQENFGLYGDTDSHFDNHISTDNLVDGRPIYYIKKVSDKIYDSSSNAGTLYCISCMNVTIKNLNLNKNGRGIFFWNTTHSRIQNVYASDNYNGICLSYSSDNKIYENNVSNNDYGIDLSYSSKNKLNGNNVSNNGHGIYLSYSSKNKLNGNNVSNNGHGIYLLYSSKNTMNANNAANNTWDGIFLSWSHSNMLIANDANSNDNGIFLSYSSENTMFGNNVSSNNENGITLTSYYSYSSSINNTIYNNIFNNSNNIHFYDPNNNTWNTTKQSGTNIIGGSLLGGNFWAYPNGTGFSQTCRDLNSDGICDKSYNLDKNNIDYLPLAKDRIPPKSVSKLKNITYAKNYINWTWKDPKDIDFKKVMVFIDSKFKGNVSKGKRFYNATNFEPNTRHTISTRTMDRNGNINKTWTNSSAWTAKS